jgi:hypothetical protein
MGWDQNGNFWWAHLLVLNTGTDPLKVGDHVAGTDIVGTIFQIFKIPTKDKP